MKPVECRSCQTVYKPRQTSHVFCSRECASAARPGRPRNVAMRRRVLSLRKRGLLLREIAAKVGRSVPLVGRWVNEMELEGLL